MIDFAHTGALVKGKKQQAPPIIRPIEPNQI